MVDIKSLVYFSDKCSWLKQNIPTNFTIFHCLLYDFAIHRGVCAPRFPQFNFYSENSVNSFGIEKTILLTRC